MHRFFAEPSQIGEKEIRITGPDVNHIRNVLRMRPGEELLIADGTGGEYRCLISEIREDEVRALNHWSTPSVLLKYLHPYRALNDSRISFAVSITI